MAKQIEYMKNLFTSSIKNVINKIMLDEEITKNSKKMINITIPAFGLENGKHLDIFSDGGYIIENREANTFFIYDDFPNTDSLGDDLTKLHRYLNQNYKNFYYTFNVNNSIGKFAVWYRIID